MYVHIKFISQFQILLVGHVLFAHRKLKQAGHSAFREILQTCTGTGTGIVINNEVTTNFSTDTVSHDFFGSKICSKFMFCKLQWPDSISVNFLFALNTVTSNPDRAGSALFAAVEARISDRVPDLPKMLIYF
jgi:hypothetical protein